MKTLNKGKVLCLRPKNLRMWLTWIRVSQKSTVTMPYQKVVSYLSLGCWLSSWGHSSSQFNPFKDTSSHSCYFKHGRQEALWPPGGVWERWGKNSLTDPGLKSKTFLINISQNQLTFPKSLDYPLHAAFRQPAHSSSVGNGLHRTPLPYRH